MIKPKIPKGVENKVIVVDNVFSETVLDDLKKRIKEVPKELWSYSDANVDYVKYRLLLNTFYGSHLKYSSHIMKKVGEILFGKENMSRMKSYNDFAFKLVDWTDVHKIYVTSHISGKPCGWHNNDSVQDAGSIQLLSFIFHIDIGNKFTGGELDVSYDEIKTVNDWFPERPPTVHQTVKYKDNRLVIIPTWMWHTVRTIKTDNEKTEALDGRITINGHLGFLRSGRVLNY